MLSHYFSQISLICVGFVTIYDLEQEWENINYSKIYPYYFYYFIQIGLFFQILVINCDMKLLVIIIDARISQLIMYSEDQTFRIIKFFVFYFILGGIFLTLLNEYQLYNSFQLIIGFFMIPQIIHNIRFRSHSNFIPEYIFGFLFIKISVPLYYRGFPNNFRRLKPSIEFCICQILIYIVQILILYYQYKKGLQDKKYNYFQDYKSQEAEDCVICLCDLMMESDQQELEQDRILQTQVLMITPCGHKFHPICLVKWMNIKLSCPTCRYPLPIPTLSD